MLLANEFRFRHPTSLCHCYSRPLNTRACQLISQHCLVRWGRLWIARLVGELPNDVANFASELANRRFRSVKRAANGARWTGSPPGLGDAATPELHRKRTFRQVDWQREPLELCSYRRVLLGQLPAPLTNTGTRNPASARLLARQLGCQSRQLSWQATTSTESGDFAELSSEPAVSEYELLPLDESGDRHAFRRHAGQPWQLATFGRLTDGTSYVFADGLMMPKVH